MKTSEKQILDNKWNISHKDAIEKASEEFEKYKKQYMNSETSDYDIFLKTIKKLPKK